MNLRLELTILFQTAMVVMSVVAQESPAELVTLKARRTSAQESSTTKVRTDYVRELEVMLRTAQGSGDLDGAIAIEQELKLARVTGETTTGGTKDSPLAARRTRYQSEVQAILAPIQIKYIAELEKLQALYTKRGQLESALLVRDELNNTKSEASSATLKSHALLRPKDSVEHRGKFYKVFDEVLSWHEARDKCLELGGSLATVQNAEVNDFILSLAAKGSNDSYWLGASDETREGEWVWTDGRAMTFSNWGGQQPNNAKQSEHYVVLLISFRGLANQEKKWSDQPNLSEAHTPGFICEWK